MRTLGNSACGSDAGPGPLQRTGKRTRRFPDPRPPRSEAEFEPNEWSPSYALYLESKRVGSLLIEARRGS